MADQARTTGRPLLLEKQQQQQQQKPIHGQLHQLDVEQSADYTVTDTRDQGGLVLTNVEVAVVFWGSYWSSTTSPPSPSSDTYYQAMTGLVTGPYLTGLRQYRGVGPGTMLGKFINTTTDPTNGYTDSDIVNMLTAYFQNNSAIPPPTTGHTRLYAVLAPPGIDNGLSGANGQHQSFSYNSIPGYYCWVDTENGLTGNSLTAPVIAFSHELAEACTDPVVGTAWLVDGKQADGTPVTGDEVGDTCRNQTALVEMNSVQCYVQCYWSAADNACIIPLGTLTMLVNKNTFGKDEVQAAPNGLFSSAFWLALDDYSIDTFNSFNVQVPTPTGPFASLPGVTISMTPATAANPNPAYEDSTNTSLIQRILYSFDIQFDTNPLTTPFPNTATAYPLTATFSTNGVTVPGVNSQDTVEFELVAGADPYFLNVDPNDSGAVYYLSEDLRVFTITQGQSALSDDPAAPSFTTGQTPYSYIQALIGYLNGSPTYTVPGQIGRRDILNNLPGQTGYETGDSSVMPLNAAGDQNYNFAIARVRLNSDLQGSTGEAANVRVFFRLWIAVSSDTDFNPNTTYLSNPPYPANPTNPLPSAASTPPDPSGQSLQTTPFFATSQSGTEDYDPTVANNNIRLIQIPTGSTQNGVWAYYGCFLDVYNSSNNTTYPGTHHCLVAQIAYDNAPILYESGVATNPGNTDKLAQRNLQITSSGNPGPASTHRIPQTFDTRPSLPFLDPTTGIVLNKPDELMIDWGNTPAGSAAQIYWPDVQASDVVALANRLYGPGRLTTIDKNTIGFKSPPSGGITYIPIPSSSTTTDQTFAGLFTVDLPVGERFVRRSQEFDILIRRIATQHVSSQIIKVAAVTPPIRPTGQTYRYITGGFQVTIPVMNEAEMLGPEENTLAILKARLAAMDPRYRWYPVVERYINYVSGRVDGAGGDAGEVPPSLEGFCCDGDDGDGCCHRKRGGKGECPHKGCHRHRPGCGH